MRASNISETEEGKCRQKFCPLFMHDCPYPIRNYVPYIERKEGETLCFLSISSRRKKEMKMLENMLSDFGFRVILALKVPSVGRLIFCKICKLVDICDFAIVELTEWNANVLIELGFIYGLKKPVLILLKRNEGIPSNLRGIEYLPYNTLKDLKNKLKKVFSTMSKDYIEGLRRREWP